MSVFIEGLQAVHALFAPQEVKRLAKQFERNDVVLSLNERRNKVFSAQSAEEAAYYVQHAGFNRRDMRQIVFAHIHREDFARFSHIVVNSQDKSRVGTAKTIQNIEAYVGFRRSHRAFFVPNLVGQTLDRINAFIPSAQVRTLPTQFS